LDKKFYSVKKNYSVQQLFFLLVEMTNDKEKTCFQNVFSPCHFDKEKKKACHFDKEKKNVFEPNKKNSTCMLL